MESLRAFAILTGSTPLLGSIHHERPSIVQGVSADRTGAGRFGDHRPQGPGQHHDDELAHGNGVITPLIGCIIGPWDYSFTALRATKECVIAVPTVDLASKVVDIGNCSGEEVDKFKAFELTPCRPNR